MMETGELFVVYRECDEDKRSEAVIGGGAQRPALQISEIIKRGARTRGKNPVVQNIGSARGVPLLPTLPALPP